MPPFFFFRILLMASLVLGVAGSALGGALLPGVSVLGATFTGAQIGGALGALAGGQIDAALTGGRHASREGPRLSDLSLQASQEGVAIPRLYGRVRLAGQLIWASRFTETAATTASGGGKGAPSVSETDYAYSISFAVGLCEGVCAHRPGLGQWDAPGPVALHLALSCGR